ncbi:hypothetical protein [Actinokineospora globicatena]|uniref:hypothetical protein n=1 Tax=Actinokineospora globicatena TaxID=103729 RepID=UPI0020A4854E|nr:hypothetical protein [Actinokineospora globicatena]MCP2303515.1 hypothetical protein [Actinokineospora globicatena]GLW79348.1 hypothetical protein Aglo01_38300 [Actinokineospora globicatena]GLW86242.1 hypothetical protein Aglo02_38810 [Actinokineospora globicatena]
MGKRLTVIAGAALALGALAPATATATPAHAYACTVVAKQTVIVRASANTGSTAKGQLNTGDSSSASCSATSGGSYTACGGSSTWWIHVSARGGGYVAQRCVDWYT